MFVKALLVGALATLAAAQSTVLTFTRVPNPVTAGQPQAITYATNDTSSPVTIVLRKGPPGNLQTISTLTQSANGGQYIWTPSNTLENASDYALQITQGDQLNFFGPFTVQGATGMASGSSSMGSASMTSSRPMSTGSAYSSALGAATITSSRNMSAVATATYSAGSVIPMSRNSTMSSPTLSSTGSATGAGPTNSAGFQGSSTPSAPAAGSTGGASGMAATGSAVALVFGAAAAVLFA